MAILTRTFISKSNTIIYGDEVNLGMNPIMELYYGQAYTRGLIYFDIERLKGLVDDKTYPDVTKLHHRLKLQNVAGLATPYSTRCNMYNNAVRAKSFDLVFFLIDKDWDMGGGFDYLKDGYDTVNRIRSTDGSNWYQATNMEPWTTGGVLSRADISARTIGTQHFDVGNESIDLDITETVNRMIVGETENHGIGIAFCDELENRICDECNYVGFFTDHTHTFFHPCVETTYDDSVSDDRTTFYLDKDNRLYFYASVGGEMTNLDKIPACTVNGANYPVSQATKGIYYIDISMPSSEYEPEVMHYDTWSNLYLDGRRIPDQELYFTTKAAEGYFSFGLPYETKKREKIVPSIHGIGHKETIQKGNVVKVNVSARIAYTTRQESHISNLSYKLYSKAGREEIPVIGWQPVERGYNEYYFHLNTNELVPGRYFIGIRLTKGMEETICNELCEFEVADNKEYMKV